MHDRVDPMVADDLRGQLRVAHIADDQRHVGRHRLAYAGREIVDHDNAEPRRLEGEGRVTADIACAAGDENAHDRNSLARKSAE